MTDEHLLKRQRIRERAYKIWHEEGQPEGREIEHWDRAEKDIEDEDSSGNGATSRSFAWPLVSMPGGAVAFNSLP